MAGTTTSIRQSCDRCRGQKLRCERDEERDTGACTRCIRLGAQCVYSHSLPKGRPNQYLPLAGSGSGGDNNNNGSGGAVGNVRGGTAAKRKAAASIGREGPKGASRGEGAANTATSLDTTNNQPQPRTGSIGTIAAMEDSGKIDPFMPSASSMPFAAAPTLPWLGQWSWTDLMLEDEMDGLNALAGQSSGLPLQSPLLDRQFAAMPEWDAAHTKDKTSLENSSHGVNHVLEAPSCIDTYMLESRHDSGECNFLTPASDAKGPGAALAQLTQLSMRLHPLHSKSQTLAENAFSEANWKSKQALVVDKDVFGTLMSPLIHDACSSTSGSVSGLDSPEPASLGGILQEAMYATHQLLDTMAQLQVQPQCSPSKGGSPPTPAATPNSARSSKTGSPSSSAVVRHLISSCHGMLISIYTAVFEVLQRDAEWLSPMRQGELGWDRGPLTDARLVVIVQLCAYLVYRQQAAVDAYIVAPGSRPDTGTGAGTDKAARASVGNTAANELEGEMRLGLDRLRTALSIR
uniref:Zinc-finger transcription factor n=1 Tax=Phyllosticta cirsii TaxID=1986016 RepID=A0A1X9PXX9_9PEZI|nr:zinc-finger transcription factor [Phyllosticta cirsii]